LAKRQRTAWWWRTGGEAQGQRIWFRSICSRKRERREKREREEREEGREKKE
jgi:hypothetical protein